MTPTQMFRRARLAEIMVKRSRVASAEMRVWGSQGQGSGAVIEAANVCGAEWQAIAKTLPTDEMIAIMMFNGDDTLASELAEFDNMKWDRIAKKLMEG